MNKSTIRNNMKIRRAELSAEQVAAASREICRNFLNARLLDGREHVLVYADFANEVQTSQVVAACLFQNKSVYLPAVDGNDTLKIAALDFAHTKRNRYGILEPDLSVLPEVPLSGLDLVILPGLAFSKKGDRIGFGKGYYDRLLKQAPVTLLKVALAYDFQLCDDFSGEEHDIKAEVIVTQSSVIRCGV